MNIYANDKNLLEDKDYQEFLQNNPDMGYLKIRASAANEAIPIKNVKITVSKKIGNNNVIFFEGVTDESGMINDINLPSPEKVQSDEEVPKFTEYEVTAVYEPQNMNKKYTVSICCGIGVIQYVKVIPNPNLEMRNYYGY